MSVLQQMLDEADEKIEGVEVSIGQIQDQIDVYTEEATGMEAEMTDVAKADMTAYLDGSKLAELEITWGGSYDLPFSVSYGGDYGTIDYATGGITDFQVLDATANVVFEYLGVNWDSDAEITKLVGDYAFANDYLTRPLTTGASYGLYPNISSLSGAKSLLMQDKAKIEASKTAFGDYT